MTYYDAVRKEVDQIEQAMMTGNLVRFVVGSQRLESLAETHPFTLRGDEWGEIGFSLSLMTLAPQCSLVMSLILGDAQAAIARVAQARRGE